MITVELTFEEFEDLEDLISQFSEYLAGSNTQQTLQEKFSYGKVIEYRKLEVEDED